MYYGSFPNAAEFALQRYPDAAGMEAMKRWGKTVKGAIAYFSRAWSCLLLDACYRDRLSDQMAYWH